MPRDDAPPAGPSGLPPMNEDPLARARRRATDRLWLFVLVMALVNAAGPFSMQIVGPALPAIAVAFTVSHEAAQLVLSLSLVAIALATLLWGPAGDRWGRRPVMIAGLAMFALGSVIGALAPSLTVLVIGRVLQAAGAAAGMVMSRAMVRDLFERERAAQILAYVVTTQVVAPMLAPAIGGFLTDWSGWRSIFWFTAVFGLVLGAIALPQVAETHVARVNERSQPMFAAFGTLMRSRDFLAYALLLASGFGTFMAFLGAGPYVMTIALGVDATEMGLWFMLPSAGFMIGTSLTSRLTPRFGVDRMMRVGAVVAFASSLIGIAVIAAGYWTPFGLFAPSTIVAIGLGLVMPNAQAAVVSVNPRVAGSAAGLTAFLQMGAGAAFSQIGGMIGHSTPWPMVLLVAVASGLGLLAIVVVPRLGRRRAA